MRTVKISLWSFFLVFLTLTGQAQESPAIYTFLLKGKVRNSTERSFDFHLTNFLKGERIDVPLKKDGSFSKVVTVEGMQNLYFPLSDEGVELYVQPDDTIVLNWDAKNVESSLAVTSPNKGRNDDLQVNMLLRKKFEPLYTLTRQIDEQMWTNRGHRPVPVFSWNEVLAAKRYDEAQKTADEKVFALINNSFNQQVQFIYNQAKEKDRYRNLDKFMNEVYYDHLAILQRYALLSNRNDLLNNYNLAFDTAGYNETQLWSIQVPVPKAYQHLNEDIFYKSPRYRKFLADHIRLLRETKLFYSSSGVGIGKNKDGTPMRFPHLQSRFYASESGLLSAPETKPTSSIMTAYLKGKNEIKLPSVMDWYVTQLVLLNLDSYENVEAVVSDYLPKCSIKAYKDTLTAIMANLKRFAQGQPAPAFSLQDVNGETVSLSDFKGKVVLLDFWGVHCGPCIGNFKDIIPKLHKKYEGKEVVFVNICVEGSEKQWKEMIKGLKIEGVNLRADGWGDHPVCRAYNVDAIPHYTLLDKEGKFVEYKVDYIPNLYTQDRIEKLLATNK